MSLLRRQLYQLVFFLAGIYNIAFGLWTVLFPQSFFSVFGMSPPLYPVIWRCLGMVIGLFGFLYFFAATNPERARHVIAVGLVGKILGPIGWFWAVHTGEFPLRTLPLILFNDIIWWIPFAFYLLERTRPHTARNQ